MALYDTNDPLVKIFKSDDPDQEPEPVILDCLQDEQPKLWLSLNRGILEVAITHNPGGDTLAIMSIQLDSLDTALGILGYDIIKQRRQTMTTLDTKGLAIPGIGDTLPNGTILVAEHPIEYEELDNEGFINHRQSIVLCVRPGAADRYTTWNRWVTIRMTASGSGYHAIDDCTWGHYHRLFEDAVGDFKKRAGI